MNKTINSLNLFANEIRDRFLIHIPHSSLYIPDRSLYLLSNEELEMENRISADIAIDTIFDIESIYSEIFNYSRLFCDVEKLPVYEESDTIGRGIYYTKTLNLKDLRKYNLNEYWNILNNYYIPHHNRISTRIQRIIDSVGIVTIIDAHSFNGFNNYDPDICIGVDSYHTPKYLIDYFIKSFQKMGYTTKINIPYSGTYIPLSHYKQIKNVESVMVEINKKLYCDSNYNPIPEKVNKLNTQINSLFNF